VLGVYSGFDEEEDQAMLGQKQQGEDRSDGGAGELRNQGERAVSTVSQQVEHNPLTSLAVAFALGCVFGTLIRR